MVPPAVGSPTSSNGNSATPMTRRRAGGSTWSAGSEAQRDSAPERARSAAASARLTTTSACAHRHLAHRRPASRPSTAPSTGPACRRCAALERSVARLRRAGRPRPRRTGWRAPCPPTAAADGGAAWPRASCRRSPTRRRSPDAVMRMSKPVRSSRSRIETISPSDSMSMSKSSAPTAATPSTPSVARAGCRTRLRQAKRSAGHRRASRSALRRRSSHEATTVAETPSGMAISTQVSATDGVTCTKSSAVS